MPDLQLTAPAKINLFLLITGRRADGYHELQTLFQLLDHGDQLGFTLREDDEIRLQVDLPELNNQDNLVLKAAHALRAHFGPQPGVDLKLNKRLPTGAGLGGGSSDAATALLGLNRLWQLGAGIDLLAEIGLKLGADVPLFVRGRTALATGVGEKLQPIDLPTKDYLILHPGIGVSTAEIFAHPELTRDSAAIKIAPPAVECVRNDCQAVVEALYPEVAKAIHWLGSLGEARLTGTGACVFVELEPGFTETDSNRFLERLPEGWSGFRARGVNKSPLHRELNRELAS